MHRLPRFATLLGSVLLLAASAACGFEPAEDGAHAPQFIGPRVLGLRCSGPSKYLQEKFGHIARPGGCVVLRASGPSAEAGIRTGDLMLEMNGDPVTSGPQFNVRFDDEAAAGKDRFKFEFERAGTEGRLQFEVRLAPPDALIPAPEDEIAAFMRGKDLLGMDPPAGILEYTRAIELAPTFDLAYVERGRLYWEIGDRAAAHADYDKAMQLNPDQPELHRSRGWTQFIELDLESAIFHFKRAAELDKCDGGFDRWNVDCADDFALLAFPLGAQRLDGGIPSAKRAIEFYPDHSLPYYLVAVAYWRTGQLDDAKDWATKYLDFPEPERLPAYSEDLEGLLACLASTTCVTGPPNPH